MIAWFLACALTVQAPAATSAPERAPAEVAAWIATRARAFDAPDAWSNLLRVARPAEPAHPSVVLVGRALEGTHELVAFERDVATRGGPFDVVACDVGLHEGEAASAFVRDGKGDPAAIAASFGAWGWSAAEAEQFLRALRAAPTKPDVVGIGVGSPKALSEEALVLLAKLSPATQPRSEHVLAPLRTDGVHGRPRYYQMDDNQRGILRFGLGEVRDLLFDQYQTLRADTPNDPRIPEYERCVRLLVALSQYEETMRFERESADEDPRGRILAENLIHALAGRAPTTRAVAFVRSRDLARASDATSFAARLATLGLPGATCVGTLVGAATFRAYDPNDHGDGPLAPRDVALTADGRTDLEHACAAAAESLAWFDLRVTPAAGAVAEWFGAPRRLRSSGPTCGGPVETPWDHRILGDFDALVWFPNVARTTTPAPK